MMKILAFATQGSDKDDENRLKKLLSCLQVDFLEFKPEPGAWSKLKQCLEIWRQIYRLRPSLVVMEGTGISGGIPLILGSLLIGQKYLVGTGDAVGPFLAGRYWGLNGLGWIYERLLMGRSSGVLAWTPYLVGRALTLHAPRAISLPGWSSLDLTKSADAEVLRKRLQIPEDAVVIGIVGSLAWNSKKNYCYGHEIVMALHFLKDRNIYGLIVGEGSGRSRLETLSKELGIKNIVFTGRIERAELASYLSLMDVASLPQSLDGVGSFRYSTKISEYADIGLPIVTGPLPYYYDLYNSGWIRLHSKYPWSEEYSQELSQNLAKLTRAELGFKKKAMKMDPRIRSTFDVNDQVIRATAFVQDILDTP